MGPFSEIVLWLRQAIGAIPWLAPLRPQLEQTPDWVLIAVPCLSVLIVALTWTVFASGRTKMQSPEPNFRYGSEQASGRFSTTQAKTSESTGRSSAANEPYEADTRAVRVFVSSTFLDMQQERDILIKEVFPALRTRLRTRGVELVAVDLRWGITREQSERGETLPILLSEIDRSRPFFVGFLGDRYGWVPPESALTEELKATYPNIVGAEQRSVTELEILHGILSNPQTAECAIVFERAGDWDWKATLSEAERDALQTESDIDQEKLAQLKRAVLAIVPSVQNYREPSEIRASLMQALGGALDRRFPEVQLPDAFTQTALQHAAYARERRGLHIGAGPYLVHLNQWMAVQDASPVLITGASGAGKSTLVANWTRAWRSARPDDIVYEHYLGASPDSADPMLLMRRLWEHLDRATSEVVDLPAQDVDKLTVLAPALAKRVERARVWAANRSALIVIALDGLDKLTGEQDLRWMPEVSGVKIVASSLECDAKSAALARSWHLIEIKPLSAQERRLFIEQTLAGWGRKLLEQQASSIVESPLSGSPLFLRTVLDELRVSATHAGLQQRLDYYLAARDMPDLFQRMLERLEQDCGKELVRSTLSLIWASRSGLEEVELLEMNRTSPLAWAVLRNALADALRDQVGKLDFGHDFLRKAVETRYLVSEPEKQSVHAVIAQSYFSRTLVPSDRGKLQPRVWSDLLYQLRMAGRWDRIADCVMDPAIFALIAPASYGFTFAPFLSGVDGLLPIWSEDPDALNPALVRTLASRIDASVAWSIASAFASRALDRIEEIARFERDVGLASNKIHEVLKAADKPRFEAYRNLVYSAARLAGIGPSLLNAKFGITVSGATVTAPSDQDFIAEGRAFIKRFDKTHRFVRYLDKLARADDWSGSLEDNFADPAREAWNVLEAAIAGKSREPLSFIKLSDVGYPIESPKLFETHFGGTWEQEGGRDGFVVLDQDFEGQQVWYFAPMGDDGAPRGLVAK
jgi:hypothetical protein